MELVAKNLHDNAGDLKDGRLIPGLRKSPEEGNHNALWYCCSENPMDRGSGQATVPGVAESWTGQKRLSTAQHKTEIEILLSRDDLCFIHMAENLYVLKHKRLTRILRTLY